MARENKTKYAILGVLNQNPASGYDIKKFFDKSINYFWNENFGHIYPVLKKMEQDEWIIKIDQAQEGKRSRNTYAITEAGKEALHAWLMSPHELPPPRYEILLKMFFSDEIPLEVSLERMYQLKDFCEGFLKEYKAIESHVREVYQSRENKKSQLLFRYSTLRFGILNMQSIVDWCTETIDQLEELHERSDSHESITD